MKSLKRRIRELMPLWLGDFISRIYGWFVILIWRIRGQQVPAPDHFKQKFIGKIQKRYRSEVFVETGTFRGDMIHAQRNNFNKIFSIEIDKNLHKMAEKRFAAFRHIHLMHGNSQDTLAMLPLEGPVFYWLDAHYSGGVTAMGDKECPIYEELETINWKEPQNVILIDDARCFNGTKSYPTIEGLKDYISEKTSDYDLQVKHDIITILPV